MVKYVFLLFCKFEGIVYETIVMRYFQIVRRESLTPPDENNVTWEDYINAEPGEYPTLGRQLVYKESSKTFRATVAMVSRPPISKLKF